jgi:hypothetical protein
MNESGNKDDICNEAVPAYVYMIYGGGRLKIGTTKDLIDRLDTLQNTSPNTLQIVWCAIGDRKYEKKLHAMFATDRLHGEWFNVSDDIRAFLAWNDTLPQMQASIAAGTAFSFVQMLSMCEAAWAEQKANTHGCSRGVPR